MRLRLFVPQNILQSTGNECASIGIIQISWILHEVDTLLKSVVLMGNTVMKSLTDGIVWSPFVAFWDSFIGLKLCKKE